VALERGDDALAKAGSLKRASVKGGRPGDAALAFSVQNVCAAHHLVQDRGLIADVAAVADAEASPVRLLQCRDQSRCAAMHVRMGVNAFKRRLSSPGTSGREAKRGQQISPS